jgi:hypothetical protein
MYKGKPEASKDFEPSLMLENPAFGRDNAAIINVRKSSIWQR